MNDIPVCPFAVGDLVRFVPSERTRSHYQDIERLGIKKGETVEVTAIKDGIYLCCNGDAEGWPWNEFVRKRNT